jgi:hypothetical protein
MICVWDMVEWYKYKYDIWYGWMIPIHKSPQKQAFFYILKDREILQVFIFFKYD